MAVTIITKAHDTKITFQDTPTINGVVVPPANFAGCTLKFLMKIADPTITTIPPISQTATINPDGTFSYTPVLADVSNTGKFQQEWEVN
jgi:hypothetical protein